MFQVTASQVSFALVCILCSGCVHSAAELSLDDSKNNFEEPVEEQSFAEPVAEHLVGLQNSYKLKEWLHPIEDTEQFFAPPPVVVSDEQPNATPEGLPSIRLLGIAQTNPQNSSHLQAILRVQGTMCYKELGDKFDGIEVVGIDRSSVSFQSRNERWTVSFESQPIQNFVQHSEYRPAKRKPLRTPSSPASSQAPIEMPPVDAALPNLEMPIQMSEPELPQEFELPKMEPLPIIDL